MRLTALLAALATAVTVTACGPVVAPPAPSPSPTTVVAPPETTTVEPAPSTTTNTPPPPGPVTGTPGAASFGDPYFPGDGNTGYHVTNTRLDLAYVPSSDQLSGTATITATTTQDLSAFSLDFALQTSAVTVNGSPAKFTSGNNKLTITPAQAISNGQPMTVVVTYSGVPSKVKLGGEQVWYRLKDGSGAGSVAEPYYASAWYPCNDVPSEKATWDVSIVVPAGTTAVTNGELVSNATANGQTRWVWHLAQPMDTYASMIAIGAFDLVSSTTSDGKSFIRAYSKGLSSGERKNAQNDIERTPEVIAWESSMYGPYPYPTMGGVAIDTSPAQSDAEEYETRPVYSDNFGSDDITDVVHENSHEWFGDAVSPRSWRDIWLNEGFANYTEWLWDEHTGKTTAAQDADKDYAGYSTSDKFWQMKPGDPGAKNLLEDPVYERGAMTLQALRSTVGDAVFFDILRHRVSEHMYGSEDTADFIALAERISGKDLTGLFDTWLFTTGRPNTKPSAGM